MIEIRVYKSVELDDYTQGCLLEGGQDFGEIEKFTTKSLSEALETITKYYGKPYLFDDRLEFQRNENGDGNEPMEYQIEDWKQGKRKMYLANYSFYFSEVINRTLKHDDFKKAFPTIEEN